MHKPTSQLSRNRALSKSCVSTHQDGQHLKFVGGIQAREDKIESLLENLGDIYKMRKATEKDKPKAEAEEA